MPRSLRARYCRLLLLWVHRSRIHHLRGKTCLQGKYDILIKFPLYDYILTVNFYIADLWLPCTSLALVSCLYLRRLMTETTFLLCDWVYPPNPTHLFLQKTMVCENKCMNANLNSMKTMVHSIKNYWTRAHKACCRQSSSCSAIFQNFVWGKWCYIPSYANANHLTDAILQAFLEILLCIPPPSQLDTVPIHHKSRRGLYGIVTDVSLVHETSGRYSSRKSLFSIS